MLYFSTLDDAEKEKTRIEADGISIAVIEYEDGLGYGVDVVN